MAKGTKQKKSNLAKDIEKDIWPQERDLLFRPDRYKYVRKLIAPKTCVFCDASKGKVSLSTLKVYESQYSMVVLNKYPYNNGHLLVLPKDHGGNLLELAPEVYIDLMNVLRLATKIIYRLYQCSGMNIGLNHGKVAGAGIPEHLHWHLIPRWSGDVNFFPLIAETKVVIETLPQSYKKISAEFKREAKK